LGHQSIDGLKLDAEGAKQELVDWIVELPPHLIPKQIMFELHMKGGSHCAMGTAEPVQHGNLVHGQAKEWTGR
jgi:hypothetical protein